MRARTWPLLMLAFGSLIVLIGVSGVGALRKGRQLYGEVTRLYTDHREMDSSLNAIRSGVHLSGIFVRDYLLDPSHIAGQYYRQQLLDLRGNMTQEVTRLREMARKNEADPLALLAQELDAYWDSLDPLFGWTPRQKMAMSSTFLRREVLPRRDAALKLAREIRDISEANLKRQELEINRRGQEFRNDLAKILLIAVSLGVLVAAASLLRISRLERRAEEHRLRTERAEREMRLLSQEVVRAQEEERRTISRELHDEVGQMLTALRMGVGNLEQLRAAPGPEFEAHLQDAKRLTEEALRAVRTIAQGLRPSMLDDLGLGPALEWQAREFARRFAVPVTVHIDGEVEGLPDGHRTCVYRVVQEALTNCGRHAQARDILISLHGQRELLTLTIQDDGAGFSPAAARGRGLGLIGIEERVRELGGELTIFSQPGRGTVLRAALPLPRQVAA